MDASVLERLRAALEISKRYGVNFVEVSDADLRAVLDAIDAQDAALAAETERANGLAARCVEANGRAACFEASANDYKARVAELERPLDAARTGSERWRGVALESQRERDELKAKLDAPTQPPETFAMTREALEAQLADAETRAVYGRGDMPLNPAARLTVALRKMLEDK